MADEPLLEVDHVDDHALGGRDHPTAMIALCPTCHAVKTRGAEGSMLRERLRKVAAELHAREMER
ncbi:HNH endonuclease [Streptomyces sp. A73]|nr:HNH endonuclease [Streptomyces sp. A73]